MLELRQFKQFIAVAEELSFRRAAERLHMAQPPLTLAIRRIEDELGVVLFERGNRIARITEAGEVFLNEARRTVEQAERALHVTRRAAMGATGSLRINFVDSTSNGVLPAILKRFGADYPDVELELQEAPTSDQLIAIQADRVDIGLLVLPIQPNDKLRIHPLHQDRWIVALPAGHRLETRPSVSLADLAAEPWITFPERFGPGMHSRIWTACANAGFAPRVVNRVRLMQTAVGLVAGGLGVALVPRLLTALRPIGVTFMELSGDGTPLPYQLALVTTDTASAVRDKFVEVALRAVGLLAASS